MNANGLILIAIAIGAVIVLRLNLWRALLFVSPANVFVDAEAPADQMKMPRELDSLAAELKALGFSPLGSRYEKSRLARPLLSYDFSNPAESSFATLFRSRGGAPRLYFLTPTEGEGFVITAGFSRPSRNVPGRYLAGGLAEASAERLFNVHKKRLEGFRPKGPFTQAGRIDAARAWFAGEGRRDIRMQNINGLVSSVLGAAVLMMLIVVVVSYLSRR